MALPLSDNRLDTSYLINPVHGMPAGPHRIYTESRWTPPASGGEIGAMDVWMQADYPSVYPGIRVVVYEGVTKLRDGRDPLVMLAPTPGSQWTTGQGSPHHMRVSPGEDVVLKLRLNYSWSDTAMFRDRGVSSTIAFADSSGSWIRSDQSPSVAARPLSYTGALLEHPATAPENAAWAYVILYIDAPAQVRTGNGSLYLTDLYFGTAGPAKGGVAEVGASTDARLGIVSDIYSRSREKIQLKLAGVDDLVRSGHRIELAAAAMTSTPAVWHWRQVTGPTVALNVRENTCDFIAPDVERSTRIRIGVYAASEDGGNRSDWHYFDLDVEPPMLRFRGGDDGDFSPRSPYLVGYSRGKREIWNDVIRPATYEKNPRHELEVLDLGIPDDDVVFSTETPRRMAAGGVWVNPETGDVFRNFGAGYNETDDTTASPRTSTYWVNPANGDILEWIED